MEYNKYKLGELIEQYDEINLNGEFTDISDLQGINSNKYFQECKSNKNDIDLYRYRICRHGMFSYNRATSRNGEKISIALRTGGDCIVSPSYYCFRVKDEEVLCPEYLDIWFKRPVFDRYARFNSWGSATEFFSFDDFCATEILLPPISEQRKIVHDYQVITDRIELLRKMNENLEEQMMLIYKQYFITFEPFDSETFVNTKNGAIPVSWRTGKLSEICEMLNGRAYSQDEMLLEGKYKLLRVGNFSTNDFWYYSDLELEDNKYCYPGDLLFCWSATLGLYIWNEPKTIYHYHIWKVDFSRSSALYREYVYLCLSHEIANMKNAGHGSIMLHLTKENVENMEVIIPPEHVIRKFHDIIVPYINQCNTSQKEMKILEGLKLEMLANWQTVRGTQL